MKKTLIIFTILCSILLIKNVDAGTLSWKNHKRLSPNTFEFYLEATDLSLNYLSGEWQIENGRILEIIMDDGWINTTGNNNNFYYYHNGIKTGNYKIATIKIELTKDGSTKINNLKMDTFTCTQDHLNNYFDPNGKITNETNYKKLCSNKDNTLQNLTISNGTLTPTFQSNIENYKTTVEYNVDKITLNPTLNNTKANIISNNTCNLNVGLNTCQVIVKAENGDQKTYTIEVTRKDKTNTPLSDDATLKSLTISNGILLPSFDSNIFSYKTSVPNNIELITWNAIPNHEKAHVITNSCTLKVGENTCEIVVEAENKSKKTYYLFVTRANNIENETDNDATIKSIAIENGKLIDEFNPSKKEYQIEIQENTTSITIKYILNATNEEKSTIIQIDPNTTYYELMITSPNGKKKESYRFNLIKKINNSNNNNSTENNNNNINNQKPIIKVDEIENPQTGLSINIETILMLMGLTVLGIICFKKKNIIPKI